MTNVIQFQSPSIQSFVTDVPKGLAFWWRKMTREDFYPSNWIAVTKAYSTATIYDMIALVLFSILWRFGRCMVDKYVSQPIIDISNLGKKEAKAFPESLWKLMFVSAGWTYSTYLVIFKYELFFDPSRTIFEWKVDYPIPWDIYGLYMFQITFYIYSTYETIFIDERKRFFRIILIHHFIAVLLMALSYMFRYLYVGVLVMFLHDLSEVFLELSKLASYYKTRNGQWSSTLNAVANSGFVLFGITWFVFRLYLFPMKPIYAAAYLSNVMYPDKPVPPFFFFLIGLMCMLVLLHAYKFKFIVQMIHRALTGASKEIDYIQEFNENGVFFQNRRRKRQTDRKKQ